MPPDASIEDALRRLKTGDWDGAHRIVQDIDGEDAAWIHAYLHRLEGDLGNAAYWYRRAGRSVATGDLDGERDELLRVLKAR